MRNLVLHLSLIDGIGPAIINLILDKLNLAKDLYKLNSLEIVSKFNLSEKIANKIYLGLKDKNILLKELELINKHKVGFVTVLDKEYSSLLKQISRPPSVLYFWGNKDLFNSKSIAIVGSRLANSYAKEVVSDLVPKLINNNWVITSGGAIGVDTMAHSNSISANGKTIVVLGSGLLNLYPSNNKILFRKVIINNGLIISPFKLEANAHPGNFPARNNIISGLSLGTVVIQAAIKSGAKITAHCALDQGRELFVIPGKYNDPLSAGCHSLIANGAKLVHDINDILDEFGEKNLNINNIIKLKKVNNNIKIKKLTIEDKLVIACKNPANIDDLATKFSLKIPELQNLLFDLQLNGKIKQDFSGLWVIS